MFQTPPQLRLDRVPHVSGLLEILRVGRLTRRSPSVTPCATSPRGSGSPCFTALARGASARSWGSSYYLDSVRTPT